MKKNIALLLILVLAAVLRLWNLNHYPAGLNADEAALGYNAYSLLKTGHDEHGASWPLVFRSFDDFKPGVYVYLTMPFIYFLGLNEWSVRLPSASLGVLSVYLVYLLANWLLEEGSKTTKRNSLNIGHLAALLLAISPWHLQFSRGGWEVNSATTFLLLGLVFFTKALNKAQHFFVSVFFFALSLYTYHSMRVVAPLLVVYLFAWKFFELKRIFLNSKTNKYLIGAIFFGIVLMVPLGLETIKGSTSARFSGVSIFAQSGPFWAANESRGLHKNPNSLWVRVLNNQYYNYVEQYFYNLSSHYSDPFLFFTGDAIARSKVPGMGQSYLWTLPFFAFGLWFLSKNKPNGWSFILFWFLIGSSAAALTFQSPHALRAQNIAIPLQLIIAYGIVNVIPLVGKYLNSKLVISILVLIAALGFARYLDLYYHYYPRELGFAWQYGFDQLGSYLKEHDQSYDKVIISTAYDQPYILTAFYLGYPPTKLQKELEFSTPDKFGFSTGTSFGKYEFHPITWRTDSASTNSLIVVANETVPSSAKPIATIYYPNGQPVFRIYDTNLYIAQK